MKIKYFLYLILLQNTFLIWGNKFTHQRGGTGGFQVDKPFLKPTAPKKAIIPPKKIKRKGLQGYKHTVTFSQMDFQELTKAKEEHKKAKNWDVVIKYLDRMITLCDNINEKAVLIIELANILFEQQRYDDASKWYTAFTQLYPGNVHIEYASYRVIICSSKKILSIDRDQTATEKTLELADAFLKRSDVFKKYKKEIHSIQKMCYETLAYSDCNIAEFYLKYGNYYAAEQRLKSIRNEWLTKAPDISVTLAHLEVELSTLSPQFQVPASSFKLAELKSPVKKVDMAARF